MTEPGPKSGEQDDHTAPSAAVARNPTSAWIPFGTNATTRSPTPTPARRSPCSAAPTRARSAETVSCTSSPRSVAAMTATASSGRPGTAAKACSA